ncbi:MAG: xanthine dehydrogenase small subunit [Amaricoccus sp.]|uniref:xanthine dehydrogenase small subunit n=1 Tax=Amaricoccus sp. TaxID=1872485 RepID=UPI0039E39FEB
MTAVRNEIRFLLNDREERLSAVRSSDSLLDHLRLARHLRGTKEGCAEGDCGACTVLVGRRVGEGLVYEPVNACIRLMGSLDLTHVVTVEHLAGANGELHPVQQALVDYHGSQCGFCTPGFVMSLYALWMRKARPGVAEIEEALQGNLCRCTGYLPIIKAAQSIEGSAAEDKLAAERADVLARLATMDDGARVEIRSGDDEVIVPASVDDLADVLAARPKATVVAGSTDVGLWITKFMRNISPAVFIAHLTGLKGVEVTDSGVTIGAGVSYDEFQSVLDAEFPHLSEYWRRIGGWQVRVMGTVGGNVANGSPIGDTPPALIALGASVTLRKGAARRTVPLEAYFIAYGKQDREPGEFVESLHVPKPPAGTLNAAYKVSKRREEDISAVACGFHVELDGTLVKVARLAYGGMAATPKRAAAAEAALVGRPWTLETVAAAEAAMAQDFAPLSDWRASAGYRARVAANLLRRFYLESTGETVRLVRETA